MASHDDLLDELLKEYQTPEDLLGKHGIVKQLTKDLIERVLAGDCKLNCVTGNQALY